MRTLRQASLQAITLETVATTTQAAQHAVRAYRAGGHRLVDAFDARITAPAARGAERVAPALADAVRRSGSQAGALAVQGIDAVSDRSGALIGAASSGATAQVKRMASLAQGVTNPVLAQGLDTAARLSLPGAQAVLALSERVADLAARLPQATQAAKAARSTSPRRRAGAGNGSAVRASVQRGAKGAASKPASTVRAKVAATTKAVVKPVKAAATALKAGPTSPRSKPAQAVKAQPAGKAVKLAKVGKAPKAVPVRASAKVKAARPVTKPATSSSNSAAPNATTNATTSAAPSQA